MNFYSNYRFTLDIQKSKSQVSIPVHYGDTGNRFYITFTDGGNPYIIPEGCRADIYIKKPEPHKPLVNACIIENNALIRYEFNTHTASVEGMHKCELRLYSADGRIITSPSFVMVVDQRVVYDDEIGTEEDFNRLIAMDVIATEEARVAAEEERVENENKRIEAEAERDEAERARAEAELRRENENAGRNRGGYDLVITSEDEFDQCLYPLYKDEENLTRDQAALKVEDDGAFNAPDPEFSAKSILVKGVTFKKMRGYDDVRLHIFQPSIEYIKFEDCRWETHWKVSGKNPRDPSAANYNLNTLPEKATSFNRATGNLTLTIEGVHLTEQNVIDAPANPITWGVGFRNIKVIKNCHIDYPKNYKLTSEGYRTLEMSCQFFDFADNCSISGLWDGTNVTNCKVNKILRRCTNVANVEAVNLLDSNGAPKPIDAEICSNMVNLKGLIDFSSCMGITASREEAQVYANTAEENAKNDAKKYLPKHTRSDKDLTYGGIRLYGVDASNAQVTPHARTGYGKNEIAMRDGDGRLQARYSESKDDVDEFYGSWHKQTLMPKDYIDKKIAKNLEGYAPLNDDSKVPDAYLPPYAPLVDGKVPATNLPSYVDDVIEGYLYINVFYKTAGHVGSYTASEGKIYIDIPTNKTYRYSGSSGKYIEISSSSIPSAEDIGVYTKDEVDEKVEGITAETINAVPRLSHSANGIDYRVYAQDNTDGNEKFLWASESATHTGADKTVAVRNASGQLEVASPTSNGQAANKSYVDGKILTAEASNNNGAYGAKFSDERYFTAPALGDISYNNTYYVPVAKRVPDQYAGNVRELTYVVSPAGGNSLYPGAFVVRDENKQIHVPTTPTMNTHAASKQYVEDYIAGTSFDFTLTGIDDGSERSITLCDGDTVIHGIIGTRDGATNANWTGGEKCSFSIFIPDGYDRSAVSNEVWVKDKDWDTIPVYVECRCDGTKNATLSVNGVPPYNGADVSFIRIVGKVSP